MFHFRSITSDIGEIEFNSSGHKAEWEYLKGNDGMDIEAVQPQCGCTAEIVIEGNIISATYNDSSKRPQNYKDLYPTGYMNLRKGVTVYFKDGLPLKVKNAKGVLVHNPAKKQTNIYITGKVKM